MAESAPPVGLAVPQHQTCIICELDFPFLKQLGCRHLLCETCCAGVLRDRNVECPFCRELSPVPDGAAINLPNVYAGQVTCDFCRRLKQTEDSWWCSSCKRVVCSRCEVTDHKHLDHEIEEWNGFGPLLYVASNIHQLESLKETEEDVLAKLHEIFTPVFRKVFRRLKEAERSFEGDGTRLRKIYRLGESGQCDGDRGEVFQVTSDLHSFSRLAEQIFELAGQSWSPPTEENRILGLSCSLDDISDVVMASLKTSHQDAFKDSPSHDTLTKKLTLRDLETSSGVWRYVCGAGDAMLAYNSSEIFLLEINLKDQLVKRARRFEGIAPTDNFFALPFQPLQHAFSIRLLGGKWSLTALSFLTMTAASSKELAAIEPKLKDLRKATYEKAVIAVIDFENIFVGLRLLNETSCWDIFRFQFLNNRFSNPKRIHSIGEDISCLRACQKSKDQILLAANVDSQKIHIFEFQGNMILSSRAIYPSFGPRLTICGLDVGSDLSIVINTQTDTGLIANKSVLLGEDQTGVAPWRRFMVPVSSFLGIFTANSVVLMDRYSWKLQILSLVELK